MGFPIKGEMGAGDMLGLAYGQVANWASGAAVTVFTAPNSVNGAGLIVLQGRSPTGTQPVSFTVKINGVTWGTTVSLSGLIFGQLLTVNVPSGVQPAAAPGQLITLTPLAAAVGTLTCDLIGYYF